MTYHYISQINLYIMAIFRVIMSTNPRYKTLSIPTPLHEKIKELIDGTGFNSVSSFTTFVLRQVISEDKREKPFDKEMEEKIKERLRSLGYLK